MSMTEFSIAVHSRSYIAWVCYWKSSSTNCVELWESYWISTPHLNYKFYCTQYKSIFGTRCNGSHISKEKVQQKVITMSKSLGKNLWVGGKVQKGKVNGKRFRCLLYCQWKNGSSFAYLCSYIICISYVNPALQCRTASNVKAYNLLGC